MMLYKMVYKPIKQNPFHFLTISWLQLFLGIFFQESSLHILKGRSRGGKSESQNYQGLFAHLTDQSQYLRKRMNAAHQTHLPWLLLHSLNMVIKRKPPCQQTWKKKTYQPKRPLNFPQRALHDFSTIFLQSMNQSQPPMNGDLM